MTITARYRGTCCVCGKSITPGEQIEYAKGAPTRHANCTPPTVPADAITISGGSGYGCDGWQPGQTTYDRRSQRYLTVLTASSRYYRDDGMSFGVGDESGYVYLATCRAATEAEAAPLRAAAEQAAVKRAARAELVRIADEIDRSGEYPSGEHQPDGERIEIDKQNLYGGGHWLVIATDYVWHVRNNGADGDDWSRNNVRTGGAGAIGVRTPFDAALADRIRAAAKGSQ